jgi:hypothetical protein
VGLKLSIYPLLEGCHEPIILLQNFEFACRHRTQAHSLKYLPAFNPIFLFNLHSNFSLRTSLVQKSFENNILSAGGSIDPPPPFARPSVKHE